MPTPNFYTAGNNASPGGALTAANLNNTGFSNLAVYQQTSPNMTVQVKSGIVMVGGVAVRYAGGNSGTFTAPGSNNRIDLLCIDVAGTLSIVQGVSGASPAVPAYPKNKAVLCEVYLRSTSTAIYQSDQGSASGYIQFDCRPVMGGNVNTQFAFGGNGSDGALAVASGTTTIDCANAAMVVKNYTSIAITGSGKLAFSNPHANGTVVILRCAGDVTITTSSDIDLSGLGAAGGAAQTTQNTQGNDGTNGQFHLDTSNHQGQGGKVGETASTGGSGMGNLYYYWGSDGFMARRLIPFFTGAGGGSGGNPAAADADGGAGGRGGGALIIECAGAWNFTTANGINVSGLNGSAGSSASNFGGGGGGGGGGGSCVVLYGTLTANSGTVKRSGGNGGNGANGSGGSGSNAGAGGGSGGGSYWGAGGAGGKGGSTSGSSAANGSAGSGSNGGTGGTAGTASTSSGGGGGGGAEGYYYIAENRFF